MNVSYLPAQAEQQVKLADAELRETKALEDPGESEIFGRTGQLSVVRTWGEDKTSKHHKRIFVFLLHV